MSVWCSEQVDNTTTEKSPDDSLNGNSEEQPSLEKAPATTKKAPQKRKSTLKVTNVMPVDNIFT